jgi:hypothetical protein
MEKTFCLKDVHFPHNDIARYNTLDRRVDYVIFLKKTDWQNRAKEEVFRCGKCKTFILPKEKTNHKAICKERQVTKEVSNDGGDGKASG